MKYLYIISALLFSLNTIAQSQVTRISSKSTNNGTATKRFPKINKTSEEINRLGMSSVAIGKTILPMLYRYKSENLILNGAGLREMLWVDLYACGLYLTNPKKNASQIVSINELMIIRLDILSTAISKKKLIKAFEQGFEKSNTDQVARRYKAELSKFISFLDVKVSVGDKYDIVYTPGEGTSLYVNYEKKGTIPGLDFKSAIFNMWLSESPVDKSLKKELISAKSISKKN